MQFRPLMRKARRAAKAVRNGQKILDLLTTEASREAMKMAAMSGLPSVAGVSEPLLEAFDRRDLMHLPVKQYIGQVVRAVMDEEGYEIADSGVRFSDPSHLFRSGSVYEEVEEEEEDESPEWVSRFLDAMTEAEAAHAFRILETRFSI